MNELEVIADTQKAEISMLPKSMREDSRKKLGELITLTEAQRDRLKKFLKEKIEDWKNNTSDLMKRLEDDNDLVEGIIMETDFPWVDASNVHINITEIYMDGYRSIMKRSILGGGSLWVAEAEIDELMGIVPDVESMMNYKAKHEWNIERAVDGVMWTTERDGLGIIKCPYVEEYEKARDVILLTGPEDFLREFPTPDDAGISPDEWYALQNMVETQASEEFPVEVPIEYENQTYAGPRAEIVERVDFVTFPASVPDIKSSLCRGYGNRYPAHIESIREKADDGVFYKDAAQRVIDKSKSYQANSYTQAKDDIVGISRENQKDERELFELVVKGRLDPNSDMEKFIVTYSHDDDELLACAYYYYRVDFYALFRIDERPNQLDGKSIPSKTRDLNDVIDNSVNMEINIRTISTVPMFMAQKNLKEELDPELEQNKIKPGMILWLSDFSTVAQFKVQPTDLGENAQLQERMMRVLDMYLGMPASLFAGGVPSGDPSAPGNKTAALINQGNLRMEDPISYFRYGVEELGNICLSHEYQFGPSFINYKSPDGKETKTIHRKYLRKNIKMRMAGITVLDNPDAEMQKQFQLLQQLEALIPSFLQTPGLAEEVGRDALKKGRIPGRERYLPSPEKVQQQAIEIQKQAMIQMEMEKQKAAEQQIKDNLAGAKQELALKDTARKLAEENLGLNGNQAPEAQP